MTTAIILLAALALVEVLLHRHGRALIRGDSHE